MKLSDFNPSSILTKIIIVMILAIAFIALALYTPSKRFQVEELELRIGNDSKKMMEGEGGNSESIAYLKLFYKNEWTRKFSYTLKAYETIWENYRKEKNSLSEDERRKMQEQLRAIGYTLMSVASEEPNLVGISKDTIEKLKKLSQGLIAKKESEKSKISQLLLEKQYNQFRLDSISVYEQKMDIEEVQVKTTL